MGRKETRKVFSDFAGFSAWLLSVSLTYDNDAILENYKNKFIKNKDSFVVGVVALGVVVTLFALLLL